MSRFTSWIKPALPLGLAVIIVYSNAQQQVKTSRKENRVKGSTAIGYAVDLEGKSTEVSSSLTKFLKEFGRTRSSFDYVSISGPTLGGTTYESSNVLYATTEGDDKKCKAWIGIDTANWRGKDTDKVLENVERIAYQFGVKFYRDLAQKEIDETQRALEAIEKQKTRLTNQNKDLNAKLGNNEQEKTYLEKSMANNQLEHAALLQRIENNKKSQDSISAAGLQIKKVLEAQKEKQNKIN
jgi:hypothetical protein